MRKRPQGVSLTLRSVWEKSTGYMHYAIAISRAERLPIAGVLSRMLVARRRHGIAPAFFAAFRLANKPIDTYGEYILAAELFDLQYPVLRLEDRSFGNDKLVFHDECLRAGLPTPPVLGLIGRCDGSVDHGRYFESSGALLRALERAGTERFLVKPRRGYGGRSVESFRIRGGRICMADGTTHDTEEWIRSVTERGRDFLVQPLLAPHPDLRAIMPGPGLGTFRIVSVLREDAVELPLCCLRLPIGNRLIDNYGAGRYGNLVADIDIEGGRILSATGQHPRFPPAVTSVFRHPDTGADLPGFGLPMWRETLSLVRRAARVRPGLRALGWDVALTVDGPCLIETNCHFEPAIHQSAMNRGLKAKFRELLDAAVPAAARETCN